MFGRLVVSLRKCTRRSLCFKVIQKSINSFASSGEKKDLLQAFSFPHGGFRTLVSCRALGRNDRQGTRSVSTVYSENERGTNSQRNEDAQRGRTERGPRTHAVRCRHMRTRQLGTPSDETWPGVVSLPEFKSSFPRWKQTSDLSSLLNDRMRDDTLDLLLVRRFSLSLSVLSASCLVVENACLRSSSTHLGQAMSQSFLF